MALGKKGTIESQCVDKRKTYIHNWSLQPFRAIDLVSHTTNVNMYICVRTYSLKSTPNDRFFEKLSIASLFALRFFARNLLRGNRRRNTFRISF